MHLDTRRMMINSMEIIENGLRLFIDRSSSSDFQHCIKKFKINRTLKTSKVFASYLLLILVLSAICDVTDACKTTLNFNFRRLRTTTTAPPTTTTSSPRPNITFQTYDCPEMYAQWYCLTGKCFGVKFGAEITYACECPEGYFGQRCDYKSTKNSYLTGNSHVETASIAGGAVLSLVLFSVITFFVYLKKHTKKPNEFEVESQRVIERY